MATTHPRFTEYSREIVGNGYHTVKCDFDGAHWVLTLVHTPATVMCQPPTGAEWQEFILAQSTAVVCRRVPRQLVNHPYDGRIEVCPSTAAYELARELLGTAWTVLDRGKGYKVELALAAPGVQ